MLALVYYKVRFALIGSIATLKLAMITNSIKVVGFKMLSDTARSFKKAFASWDDTSVASLVFRVDILVLLKMGLKLEHALAFLAFMRSYVDLK
jgi:hypothetical protein